MLIFKGKINVDNTPKVYPAFYYNKCSYVGPLHMETAKLSGQ